jgi:hypothetical protein
MVCLVSCIPQHVQAQCPIPVTLSLSWRDRNSVALVTGLSLLMISWVSLLPKLIGSFFSLSTVLVKFFSASIAVRYSWSNMPLFFGVLGSVHRTSNMYTNLTCSILLCQ